MFDITYIRKRNGRVVHFNRDKIRDAVQKAFKATGSDNPEIAGEIADAVVHFLRKHGPEIPHIEEIQDMVERVLIETNQADAAKAYILYRDKRTKIRENIKVRKQREDDYEDSRMPLLVKQTSSETMTSWDRDFIVRALEKETDISKDVCSEIAASVEKKIFQSGISRVSTSLIRELVDNELFERGFNETLSLHAVIGMPRYDLNRLIHSSGSEQELNNPDIVEYTLARHILKQFSLKTVFSDPVADAHRSGLIHIHSLGYPARVNSFLHSLEFVKNAGLTRDILPSASKPARHARTLTTQLNTFLAVMRRYTAGPAAVGFLNILFAPFLTGMSKEAIRQEVQNLIFITSQNAFSRGGLPLPIDFNIFTYIHDVVADVDATGPGGEGTGKKYCEYSEESAQFAQQLFDILLKGDGQGSVFEFPRIIIHYNRESFRDETQVALLKAAASLAAKSRAVYFTEDHADEMYMSSKSHLVVRTKDPGIGARKSVLQSVTVNLPQTAAASVPGTLSRFMEELNRNVDIAIQAHKEKTAFLRQLLSAQDSILENVGRVTSDGSPYLDIQSARCGIGVCGLDECVRMISGSSMDEEDASFELGGQIMSGLRDCLKEKVLDVPLCLEEFPYEITTERLYRMDMQNNRQIKELFSDTGIHSSYSKSFFISPNSRLSYSDILSRNRILWHKASDSPFVFHFPGAGISAAEIFEILTSQSDT